jgi:CrcB protein
MYSWLSGYAIVFLGAGLGGGLRHGINVLVARLLGLEFPYATLFINVSGSLAMGVLVGSFARLGEGIPQHLRLFLTTGLLGGYTTFSTFSLDAGVLFERGQLGTSTLYVLSSVGLSLLGFWLGLLLMRNVG